MVKADYFTQEGEKKEQVTLPKDVFETSLNASLFSQYIKVFLTNQTQGTHKTKVRGEVSGGGKKPWRQKGTGRARSGSNRSPVWVGGGTVHGPVPFTRRLGMAKAMKMNALKSILSAKAHDKSLGIVESITFKKAKTANALNFLNKINAGKSALFVLDPSKDQDQVEFAVKSLRNIPGFKVVLASNLNAHVVAGFKKIFLEEKALTFLTERYAK